MNKKNSLTSNSETPFEIELTIDSLSFSGGRGVGRFESVVVFVRETAPGDRVRARVTERHARFWVAEPVAILAASSHRRTPPCPVAGRCGGCSWQHVDYAEQVRQKEKILRDSLRRLKDFEWRPFVAAPDEFYYRNRIQLQIQGDQFGFFAKGSRDLVETRHCWISEPPINERLKTLETSAYPGANRLELAVTETGDLREMAGRRDPHAALFAQVNRRQNEALMRLCGEAIEGSPAYIYDLYCGAGNLTRPLRQRFPQARITAVELSQASIERARALQIEVTWLAGDVARVLSRQKPGGAGGVMVLDPPRVGLDKGVVDQLVRHRPKQLVYVSCDPQTFARDAERLRSAFKLVSVQGLDMFPQTEHVELIARFCPN